MYVFCRIALLFFLCIALDSGCRNRQYFYWYLTVEGIEYLREYLHLPEEIVPATLKKSASRAARPGPAPGGERCALVVV